MLPLFLIPLAAQAVTADLPPRDVTPPATGEQVRFDLCLDHATSDPPTAILEANSWIGEAQGAQLALPQECLGIAYSRLLRWEAAETAFLAARDAVLAINPGERARLAAMAGNSALADGRHQAALDDFALGLADAAMTGEKAVGGEIEADRSRALVGLGRMDEAAQALAIARSDAPQYPDTWLLSATLSRRNGALDEARAQIGNAAGLKPTDPAIRLEAGVIAVLSGDDLAARQNWNAVLTLAPGSTEAETAQDYLAQLDALAAQAAETGEGTGG